MKFFKYDKLKEMICFDDVQIVDGYSSLKSRRDVNLEQQEGLYNTTLPIMTASMDTVTSPETGRCILEAGGVVIHHRYDSINKRCVNLESNLDITTGINGVAIGMHETKKDIRYFIESGAELISLDVAAAYNEHVFERIKNVLQVLATVSKDRPLFMVGNFSNPSMIHHLHHLDLLREIDFLKVSQGGGSVCSTRINTGIGVPTLSAVVMAKESVDSLEVKTKIVADGGLKTPGDIVKALGAGASYVMLGSMLAGHDECPVDEVYRGMASEDAKKDAGMAVRNVEGVTAKISKKGSMATSLKHYKECIQSGIATSGYEVLEEFIGNALFIKVSRASQTEAKPHALIK